VLSFTVPVLELLVEELFELFQLPLLLCVDESAPLLLIVFVELSVVVVIVELLGRVVSEFQELFVVLFIVPALFVVVECVVVFVRVEPLVVDWACVMAVKPPKTQANKNVFFMVIYLFKKFSQHSIRKSIAKF